MLSFTRYFVDADFNLDHITKPLFLCISLDEFRAVVTVYVLRDKMVCVYDEKFCCVIEGRYDVTEILSYFAFENTIYYDMICTDDKSYMTKDLIIDETMVEDTIDLQNLVMINLSSKLTTNMSIQINYQEIYKWYNNNQHTFTPVNNIQHLYVYFDNGQSSWLVSKILGNVSLEFDAINKKYADKLQTLFGGKKMYVQVAPNDLYFVVPKQLDNRLFGDHYRLHLIPQYEPDWSTSGTIYHDMIDIHRTNFCKQQRVYKSIHNPKCVFKNNTLLFMQGKGLDFSNIECFNKRLTGYHKFDYTFTDDEEKELIKDLLSLPYENELIKKHKAAEIIQRAINCYLSDRFFLLFIIVLRLAKKAKLYKAKISYSK